MLLRTMISRQLRPRVGIDISVLVRCLADVKLSDPLAYCNIKKLEVNQKISQMSLDRKDYLDKSVKHILKKDIQVFEMPLMLNRRVSLNALNHREIYRKSAIADGIKTGRWNPNEDQLIQKNMDILLGEMRSKKNREVFLENLFSPSEKKYTKEKINIVGSFLGQGLKDPRLPCEIFNRARILLGNDDRGQKIIFTEEDDKTIIDYLNNNKKDSTPFRTLSKMLGYPRSVIYQRNNRILQHGGDKFKRGVYTDEENKEIISAVFHDNKNALQDSHLPSDPLWEKLGRKLKRRPFGIYQHWEVAIKVYLLKYEHGREDVDFRIILIDYFLENNIMFRNETSWSEVMKDERFKGTTAAYLQRLYCDLIRKVKKKYPGIEEDEITSQTIKSYLDGRKRFNKKGKDAYLRLTEDYVSIREKM